MICQPAAREQRPHLVCGRFQRRPGFLLTCQRVVQVHLQDLRELRVDRRHGPWTRRRDDAPCRVGRDPERALESGAWFVQRRPRRKLRDDASPFEHLFRSREVLDERPGGLRARGPGVDGEL